MQNHEMQQAFYHAMSDNPSHAWLITGADARESALGGAARLLCQSEGEKPCGHCKACKMREADAHPDFRHLSLPEESKGSSIKVEEVRDIRDWLAQAPQYGRNVLVMEGAQRMTEAAQNALLRSLEEPPENSYFLLTGDEGGLLPTLRSRLNPLRLGGEEASLYQESMEAAQNQILRALRGDWNGLATAYGGKKTEMQPLLGAQAELLRDLLAAGLGAPLLAESRKHSLQSLSQGLSPRMLNRWLASTLEASERLDANANPSMVSDWLGIKMKRAGEE